VQGELQQTPSTQTSGEAQESGAVQGWPWRSFGTQVFPLHQAEGSQSALVAQEEAHAPLTHWLGGQLLAPVDVSLQAPWPLQISGVEAVPLEPQSKPQGVPLG